MIGALLDECAFWHSDEGGASPDTEILNAIRPATATIPGAPIVGLSSPYRRHGILWNAFNQYFGKPGDLFVWNAPTQVMNPRVPVAIIEQAYREDDPAASAEYGACFRRDLERYISQEAVAAVTVPGRLFNEAADGVTYAAFCDRSGGSQDSMTLGIAHKDGKGRAVLDLVLERRAPFNPDAVTDEFCAALQRYSVREVAGDHYAGLWPRVRFEQHGITYRPSDDTKSEIYQAALPLLTSGQCELLDYPRLFHRLVNLERKTSRSGKDSIDHPPRGTDDVVNAVCCALVAVTRRSRCPIGIAKLPEWM